MKNLNVKISFLIGVVTFIVSVLIGHYTNNVSSNQLKLKEGEHLLTVAKNINDILDREMLERYREMKFAASLNILSSDEYSIDEKRAYIQKIKDGYNHHEWIGFALPDGTVQIGTNGYLEGKNVKARPWHPEGLKGPYIGDVHDALLLAKLLPNTSGEVIYFTDVAFPVTKINGEIAGVLCTHLTWQWTREIIRSIQKDKGIEVYLLSNDGMILVGPENSERMNIKEISNNVANEFLTKEEKYEIIQWNKEEKYLTASSVSKGIGDYKGFSWKVIVRQPVKSAFAEVEENSKNIYIISFLATFIGILIGIVFSNLITKPIKKLIKLVDSIKEGKDIQFIENISGDEVGKLHDAIKNLYENLKKESNLREKAQVKVDISLKLFEQASEGIIVTDLNNNIILINEAFTKITGYTYEDVYHKNPNILSSGEESKEFYENMWNEIKTKNKWKGSLKNRKKDGSIYLENLKITTLNDKDGNILHYIATFSS